MNDKITNKHQIAMTQTFGIKPTQVASSIKRNSLENCIIPVNRSSFADFFPRWQSAYYIAMAMGKNARKNILMNKFCFIILSLMFINSYGQNNMNMNEKFDIEKFKRNVTGYTYEFVLDGVSITQSKFNGGYLEVRIFPDNIYFQTDKTFNEKGILVIEGTRYRHSESFRIGIWKYYNQEGKLVREEDYGKFDWNKILDIAEQYKIDLADTYSELVRHTEAVTPCWKLSWVPRLGANGIRRTIIIDAENYTITDESETRFFIIE